MVEIYIDDKKVEAAQGSMIIEVADELGISIPRFCYHPKLSIAANCRMCLVDVANSLKPVPACATPVSDGMKVYTKSSKAKNAQKSVMEFLLINHPLDCPICDQGGQCELQDVAMGYGKDISRFTLGKRAVSSQNLGPLIATDMTRCIHCTRCVRFGDEISGQREMGATGRGEHVEIGTYLEKSVDSELSGNVIDLCPVGALTSKPFRYTARSWELQSYPGIANHDCIGSNIYYHAAHNKVKRVVPRKNDDLNEVWLTDKDRFSYQALDHQDRLKTPLLKVDGNWQKIDWETALNHLKDKISGIIAEHGPNSLGALISPNCTLEEHYLLQKVLRSKGCHNIDHRFTQLDFSWQNCQAMYPKFQLKLNDIADQDCILILGSDLRSENPLLNHRVRQAKINNDQLNIIAINAYLTDYNYDLTTQWAPDYGDILAAIAQVIRHIFNNHEHNLSDQNIIKLIANIEVTDNAKQIADRLLLQIKNNNKIAIILGEQAICHPHSGQIYYLVDLLVKIGNAKLLELTNGANTSGAWLAGSIPHRLAFGEDNPTPGLTTMDMLQHPLKAYLVINCEPQMDLITPRLAQDALMQAKSAISFSVYDDPNTRSWADLILPITPASESGGVLINALGQWQKFSPAIMPKEQAKPLWKILRVLGNLLNVADIDYENIQQLTQECETKFANKHHYAQDFAKFKHNQTISLLHPEQHAIRIAPRLMYNTDAVVRRASALQATNNIQQNKNIIKINQLDANKFNLTADQKVFINQDGKLSDQKFTVKFDSNISKGTIWLPFAQETTMLGAPFGLVELVSE